MEYIKILSMILDNDKNTTSEYSSIFENVPSQCFVDSKLLSDTPIINPARDGRYISLRKEDGIVVLDYFTGGKGSIKSCTKKAQFEFVRNLSGKLFNLEPDRFTDVFNDLYCQQLCMAVTIYNLHKNPLNFNQVIEKPEYTVCYYLRKNKNGHHFLQSEIRLKKPAVYKNYQLHEHSLFFDIKPAYQKLIKDAKRHTFFEEIKGLIKRENGKDDDLDDLEFNDDDFEDLDNTDLSF